MQKKAPQNKNFQWFGNGIGLKGWKKLPKSELSDYAFREKKSEYLLYCRAELQIY